MLFGQSFICSKCDMLKSSLIQKDHLVRVSIIKKIYPDKLLFVQKDIKWMHCFNQIFIYLKYELVEVWFVTSVAHSKTCSLKVYYYCSVNFSNHDLIEIVFIQNINHQTNYLIKMIFIQSILQSKFHCSKYNILKALLIQTII